DATLARLETGVPLAGEPIVHPA
ncbi:MAG: hypothetical protein QOF38_821, partial [Pseudonocardiales bacterium]|nr:hypothetical protein [Pseudonocardiales bacterium]